MWRLLSSLWKRPTRRTPAPAPPPDPTPPPEPAEDDYASRAFQRLQQIGASVEALRQHGPPSHPFPVISGFPAGYSQLEPPGPYVGRQRILALSPTGQKVVLERESLFTHPWPESAARLEPFRSPDVPYLLRLLACHLEIENGHIIFVWESAEESLIDWFNRCRKEGANGIPHIPLLGYLGEVAGALDYLRSREVRCGCLTPNDLLVSRGHARVGSYAVLGGVAAEFVPPEGLRQQRAATTEQYQLALIYFQMRTGRFPFEVGDPIQTMLAIEQGGRDLSPLPEAERPIVDRALQVNPDHRYGSCVEFVDSLKGTVAPACLRALPGRSRPDSAWLAWNGGTVGKLAAEIDDSHDFTRLPLLADALEDAGCADAELLGHLRGPGPHVRGCRALGLLLDKGGG